MTDNEIIKALEICILGDCDICSCKCGVRDCRDTLNKHALDLIDRQQKDIDDLCKVLGRAYQENCFLEVSRKCVKAEAIKEFAEKLIDQYPNGFLVWGGDSKCRPFKLFVDTLVKEMVGD